MPAATPYTKVLVANRGEIALRILRSARALGYRTVAVCSSVDAQARHVLEADQSVCIGGPLPAESYLDIAALIDAARRTGADAVHPGYGFLAENADFAQACREAGLVFIGPSAAAIRAMGHKAGAKQLMREAGVPCVPGYQGESQEPQRLAEEAARIGYPVMIKAVAGGGGRGLRRVDVPAGFDAALRSARSEAAHAFGDATVILERAIARPRHVEIQVFADRHGGVVHLGERDCSVQRRHQKLLEEAPSPAVDAALRERMGATAVAAVRALGYEGAGTLEFLLDEDGRYYFMEMNTRLQVEHPVTEAVTGLDLVEWQLRVAAGEPLPMTQDELRVQGHAIEVRLCAEDVQADFLPHSGHLLRWQPPPGLRVEHALGDGAPIPAYYDSMMAKLVAHGRTREEARRRLLSGLQDLVALGVRTNQAFLARCLRHPVFVAGQATTAFVDEHQAALCQPEAAEAARAAALAAVLLHETDPQALQGPARALARRLPTPMRFDWSDGGPTEALLHETAAGRFQVQTGGTPHEVVIEWLAPGRVRLSCDGIGQACHWAREGDTLHLALGAEAWTARDIRLQPVLRHQGGPGDGRLRASMSGRVVALQAVLGQPVAAGEVLVTLEAMKMEHQHRAPAAGRVSAVHVALGDQVSAARVMLEIEPAG